MIDVETVIRGQLSKLDPLPATLSGDWDNVLSRVQWPAQTRQFRERPRRVAFAVAAAAMLFAVASVVTPLGAAIGRGLGDFSAWISGSPGTPASPGDQQTFTREGEQASKLTEGERSWANFPAGTQLRRLLQTEAAGMTFELFGFRSSDSLCLRLVVSGTDGGTRSSCAPLSALQQAKEPAIVIDVDEGFGAIGQTPPPDGYLPEKASATFGITADGVRDVVLTADDGDHHALIDGNAFLYVADHPALGERVRSVNAIAANGSTVALPFSRAPFGVKDDVLDAPSARPVTGPKGIERKVSGGYDFPTIPFTYSVGLNSGGDQFAHLEGDVSGDVYSIDLYLTDGTIQKVTIENNSFIASWIGRVQFPVRIVARDKQGAIIGNQVIPNP
jgi:hypothetical protein